jgi:hypothetical protein
MKSVRESKAALAALLFRIMESLYQFSVEVKTRCGLSIPKTNLFPPSLDFDLRAHEAILSGARPTYPYFFISF